jgi:hypothetical protein
MTLEQVVFFLMATRYLRLPGEWFWWGALVFWILAGIALAATGLVRAFTRRISAGTPPPRPGRPIAGVPAAKEG